MKYDQRIIDEWTRKGLVISNTPCGRLPTSSHYDAPFVSFELPIKTTTESNSGGHWRGKHYRGKKQIAAIQEKLSIYPAQLLSDLANGCTITLTRVAFGTLDEHDNLPSAFKHIVDGVAQSLLGGELGKMDSDPRLSWEFKQVKGKRGYYGVIVTIQPRERTES